MKIALIIAIILAVLMAFFAVENSQQSQVMFMGWYFDAPLVIILLITFGMGVITMLLAMLPGSVRKSIEIAKLNSRIADYAAKLERLEHQLNAKESQPEKGISHENDRN